MNRKKIREAFDANCALLREIEHRRNEVLEVNEHLDFVDEFLERLIDRIGPIDIDEAWEIHRFRADARRLREDRPELSEFSSDDVDSAKTLLEAIEKALRAPDYRPLRALLEGSRS